MCDYCKRETIEKYKSEQFDRQMAREVQERRETENFYREHYEKQGGSIVSWDYDGTPNEVNYDGSEGG